MAPSDEEEEAEAGPGAPEAGGSERGLTDSEDDEEQGEEEEEGADGGGWRARGASGGEAAEDLSRAGTRPVIPMLAIGKAPGGLGSAADFDDEFVAAMKSAPPSEASGHFDTAYERALAEGPSADVSRSRRATGADGDAVGRDA